jgi:hypothetical protein
MYEIELIPVQPEYDGTFIYMIEKPSQTELKALQAFCTKAESGNPTHKLNLMFISPDTWIHPDDVRENLQEWLDEWQKGEI